MTGLEAVAEWPVGTPISAVVAHGAVTVVLRLSEADAPRAAVSAEETSAAVHRALLGLPIAEVHVLALDPRDPRAPPRPLHAFEPLRPRESKPAPALADAGQPGRFP
jgi:hypothetical protein